MLFIDEKRKMDCFASSKFQDTFSDEKQLRLKYPDDSYYNVRLIFKYTALSGLVLNCNHILIMIIIVSCVKLIKEWIIYFQQINLALLFLWFISITILRTFFNGVKACSGDFLISGPDEKIPPEILENDG